MALALAWIGLNGAAVMMGERLGKPLPVCLFKWLTRLPCPSCGFARGTLCLLRGRVLQAWLFNPLLFTILASVSTGLGVRLLSGRAWRVRLTRTQRAAAWAAVATMFLANWAYVILCVG